MEEDEEFKSYTKQARRGIQGEAFFESMICSFAVPHQVVGHKDLGIDYFCEWVHGDKPTGILFAMQVKAFPENAAKIESRGEDQKYNGLEKYQIRNANLKIEKKTLLYWRALALPLYLFAVVEHMNGQGEARLDCYYKRYTPILTGHDIPEDYEYTQGFYKVNRGSQFLAFKKEGALGFARDLFIDQVRWSYYKGLLSYPYPSEMGLSQFPDKGVFSDLYQTYCEKIRSVQEQTQEYLKAVEQDGEEAQPSIAPDS
jgi:hypothetical protein